MIDHRSYTHNLRSCEIKAWKNTGLNEIRTHGLCSTSAVLYWLSYQAIWKLVTLWVRWKMQMNTWKIIPVYLNCGERHEFMIGHRSYTHTISSCEIKAWKKIQAMINQIYIFLHSLNSWSFIYPFAILSTLPEVRKNSRYYPVYEMYDHKDIFTAGHWYYLE